MKASAGLVGDKVSLGLRPHHFDIVKTGGTESVIALVERLGNETTAVVELADGRRLTVNLDPTSDVSPGQKLNIVPQLQHAAIFDTDGVAIGRTNN